MPSSGEKKPAEAGRLLLKNLSVYPAGKALPGAVKLRVGLVIGD